MNFKAPLDKHLDKGYTQISLNPDLDKGYT